MTRVGRTGSSRRALSEDHVAAAVPEGPARFAYDQRNQTPAPTLAAQANRRRTRIGGRILTRLPSSGEMAAAKPVSAGS
jgi:hypothetical protein